MVLDIVLGGFAQGRKVHAWAVRCFPQAGRQVKNVLALDLLHGFALIARDICWYDGVTDQHYENGKYYKLGPQPPEIIVIDLTDCPDEPKKED